MTLTNGPRHPLAAAALPSTTATASTTGTRYYPARSGMDLATAAPTAVLRSRPGPQARFLKGS